MAPPLYRSQTRLCAVANLPTTLRNALVTHADAKHINLVSTQAWVTHRENPPATGLFGKMFKRRSNPADPDAEHDMLLVLHATHLLVGTAGAVRGASVMSLPLLQASVVRGSAVAAQFAGRIDAPEDDGLTISGFPGHEGRPGTYFFGLGAGDDAQTCVNAVLAAVAAAKNPA